jgi:hypothetical protein
MGVGAVGTSVVVGVVAVVATAVLVFKPAASETSASSPQRVLPPANALSAKVNPSAAVALVEKPAFHRWPSEPRGEVLKEKRDTKVDPGAIRALRPSHRVARVAKNDSSPTIPLRLNTVNQLHSGPSRVDPLGSNDSLESASDPTDHKRKVTDSLLPNEAVEPKAPSPAPEVPNAANESNSQMSAREPDPSAAPRQVAATRPDDPFVMEMRDITNAERLLSTDPASALVVVRKLQTQFPSGYFSEERAYVEVMALLGIGRISEGRAKADEFLRVYPIGPYSQRVGNAAVKLNKGASR